LSVRVRYAPSPTGLQHIGSARTALYNHLFARSMGGKFILRIEDTDRARFAQEALQDIYDSYAWLGFHWDEGPDVGGPKGPYIESERLELFRKYADALLAAGHAYRCYCTSERLEKLRQEQQAGVKEGEKSGDPSAMGYDRHCRNLTDAERATAEASGTPSVIRLKIPLSGSTTYADVLLGEITIDNRTISPDPVLMKSDGFPTYHLAAVVDDHLMEITHIMRGQEWLPSVPMHVILNRALGWDPPVYCHLPMVMGKDGHKLSKRLGSTSIRDFRAQGYLPEALLNCIALVGWSYDGSRELFSLRELEELFDISKLNKAPGVFDYQKLEWFNGVYIRKKSPEELAKLIRPFLEEAGLLSVGGRDDEELLGSLVPLVQERMKRLSDVPSLVRFVFEEPAGLTADDLAVKKAEPAKVREALTRMDGLLAGLSDSDEENEKRFRALADELDMKMGDMLMPLRVAVTGSKVSPPLFPSIRVLGTAKARSRVAKAIAILDDSLSRS
jgi:glutamyl-tRNA synthetase